MATYTSQACDLIHQLLEQDSYDPSQLNAWMHELMNVFSVQIHCESGNYAPISSPSREEDRNSTTSHCGIPALPAQKKLVHYDGASKVALQKFWDSAIHDGQHTNILDQGIHFDSKGFPYEDVQSSKEIPDRQSPSSPCQEPGRRGDNPGCRGPRESG